MDTYDLLNAQTPAELRLTRVHDNNGSKAVTAQSETLKSEGERLFVLEVRRGEHGRPTLVVDFAPR